MDEHLAVDASVVGEQIGQHDAQRRLALGHQTLAEYVVAFGE